MKKKEEKEIKKTKVWSIIGMITFTVYLLLVIVSRITTSLLFHIPFLTQLTFILKSFVLNGYVLFYILYSGFKKTNKVLHILLLVVFVLSILSNIIDLINELRVLIHYGGNTIYYLLNIIEIFFNIILYIILSVSALGLSINKKLAPKVLAILSFVGIGLVFVSGIAVNFWGLSFGMNIRNILSTVTGILIALFYTGFQVSLIFTLKENIKEIK